MAKKKDELLGLVEIDEELRGFWLTRFKDGTIQVSLGGSLLDTVDMPEDFLEILDKELYWKDLNDFAANRKGGKNLRAWLEGEKAPAKKAPPKKKKPDVECDGCQAKFQPNDDYCRDHCLYPDCEQHLCDDCVVFCSTCDRPFCHDHVVDHGCF